MKDFACNENKDTHCKRKKLSLFSTSMSLAYSDYVSKKARRLLSTNSISVPMLPPFNVSASKASEHTNPLDSLGVFSTFNTIKLEVSRQK